jgi:hypothetical protein
LEGVAPHEGDYDGVDHGVLEVVRGRWAFEHEFQRHVQRGECSGHEADGRGGG